MFRSSALFLERRSPFAAYASAAAACCSCCTLLFFIVFHSFITAASFFQAERDANNRVNASDVVSRADRRALKHLCAGHVVELLDKVERHQDQPKFRHKLQ